MSAAEGQQHLHPKSDIEIAQAARLRPIAELEREGFGRLPLCMAKTQYSFTTDPAVKAAPAGHVIPIRELRLSAGAEFVVVICGDIITMPSLPKVLAANTIEVSESGRIAGLF